jgi:hypothetical protein
VRAFFASTSLAFLIALASTAFAQTAPTAAQPAPGAASPVAQPTPDVPTPPPTTTAPPEAPPPPQPPPTDTIQTPGATTSSAGGSSTLAVNMPAQQADTERAPERAPDAWLDGHALAVEALFRGGSRLGSASVASDTEEKAGIGFDLGAWFRIARAFSLGLELRRMDLGNISFTSGQSSANAGYASTALALGARVYPFRWTAADLYLGIHAGLAWQDVDANGLHPSVNLQPATVYECSDSAGPGFALGGELGGELRLARAFWLVGNVAGDGYGLTSERIGNCVNGLGSVTSISVGVGLLYAFDLGSEARVAAAPSRARF